MARTRGGHTHGRRRPTASARRERQAAPHASDIQEDHLVGPTAPVQHEEPESTQIESFPGGPEDTSVLTRCKDHVATYIWKGEVHNLLIIIKFGRFCFVLKNVDISDLTNMCCYRTVVS